MSTVALDADFGPPADDLLKIYAQFRFDFLDYAGSECITTSIGEEVPFHIRSLLFAAAGALTFAVLNLIVALLRKLGESNLNGKGSPVASICSSS